MENKFDILNSEEQTIVNIIENDEFITSGNDENFWQNALKETTKKNQCI